VRYGGKGSRLYGVAPMCPRAVMAVVLGLMGCLAWPQAGPVLGAEPGADPSPPADQPPAAAPRSPAAPAAGSPEEAAVRKTEKLVFSVRDKMNDFQKEESPIEVATIKSRGIALQAVKDPKKATEQIAKRAMTPELQAYRNAVLAAVRQWQDFQQRYSGLGRTVKTLEKERANAPANLQADIDACTSKFNMKNRALQLKVAGLYEEIADYKSALAILTAAYLDVPEDKRAGEAALKMQIADLYAKSGDNAAALAGYKSILDARPEADRYKDAKLCEKLGDAYKATGELRAALDMYNRVLAATGGGGKAAKGAKAGKAVDALQKKIDDIEKKVGPSTPAKAPAK